MASQIFISYSKKDREFAWKLADDLVEAGHKVWIDRSLQVGEDWEQTIEGKLAAADEVIVILSPNSIASKWVQHEGSIAYGLKKRIYPVLLEALPVDDLPLWMSKFQYHSFIDVDYEPAFDALNAVLTPPNPIQDLLEQQVSAYRQTGNLLGAAILQVIEEARDTLQVDETAAELIEKSRYAIQAEQQKELEQQRNLEKTRRQRTAVLASGMIVALILSLISFSLYRTSNRNLENANVANTRVAAERNAAETAQSVAEQQRSLAEQKTIQAQSGQLAAIAMSKLENDFNLAILLSVESIRKDENFLSLNSLITAAQHNPKLLRSLQKHTGGVQSVAFSPDGKTLASGSVDQTIRLWDGTTGRQIANPLTGHTSYVHSVAFSPDGKTLASGSADQTIHLWDVVAGQQIGEPITGHTSTVSSVAFSPDGKILASGSWDQTVRLWNVSAVLNAGGETGQQIGEPLTGHTGEVMSVTFSPDGKTLASGSEDGTIRLWDVKTGQQVGEPLTGNAYGIYSVVFSPDGKTLASGSGDSAIRLWNMETGQQIGEPLSGHTWIVSSVAFSPDGKTLASGSYDETIRLWDVSAVLNAGGETGQQIGEPLIGHTWYVYSVAFSPDGKTLASGSNDNTIRLWDVTSRQQLGKSLTGHTEYVHSVTFSPDGKTLASGCRDSTICFWDVETGQQIGEPLTGHTAFVYSVAFSPDGKTLASGSADQTIRLWDVNTGQQIGEPLTGHTSYVNGVAFSPDGKTLASVGADQTIRLWSISSVLNIRVEEGIQIVEPLTGHTAFVNSVAFSPDGKILASGSWDRTVRLWDVSAMLNTGVATGQQVGEPLTGHTSGVYSVAFSPDGKTLASGSEDNTIRLWDVSAVLNAGVETGQQVGEFSTGYAYGARSVTFSPDGKTLASGSGDGAIRLWNLETGQQIGEPLMEHTSYVNSVAFSPDGKTLASGSEDNTIRLWNVDIESWIQTACSRVTSNISEGEWKIFFPDECYRQTCPQFPAEYQDDGAVCQEKE